MKAKSLVTIFILPLLFGFAAANKNIYPGESILLAFWAAKRKNTFCPLSLFPKTMVSDILPLKRKNIK